MRSSLLKYVSIYTLIYPPTAQFENSLNRLQSADAQIDELKSQLDDALSAEEMLVQLTERNLTLAEVRIPSSCQI